MQNRTNARLHDSMNAQMHECTNENCTIAQMQECIFARIHDYTIAGMQECTNVRVRLRIVFGDTWCKIFHRALFHQEAFLPKKKTITYLLIFTRHKNTFSYGSPSDRVPISKGPLAAVTPDPYCRCHWRSMRIHLYRRM